MVGLTIYLPAGFDDCEHDIQCKLVWWWWLRNLGVVSSPHSSPYFYLRTTKTELRRKTPKRYILPACFDDRQHYVDGLV